MQIVNKSGLESKQKQFALKSGLLPMLLLILGLGIPSRLQAQQYLATLTGSVTDTSGARVPNAEVVATEASTHFVTKATSNADGNYTIPFLAPGTYTLTITAPGFATEAKNGIVLAASVNAQVDIALKVGNVTEKVEVTADSEMLDTGTASLGTVLSGKEVGDLPNIGRNPFVLATLAPGVYTSNFMQAKASGFSQPFSGLAVQIVVNGSGGHQRLTLDGILDDPGERYSGSDYTGFVPSPEAVQEVNTQGALYDSQYGHGNGSVINTVLRTGTNAFHGSAYFVFQNTYLNANTFERVPTQNLPASNPARTPRVNNQWTQPGAVLDGPVRIPHVYNGTDKTFFMVAYERIQSHQPIGYQALVPTDAERTGNFSALCKSYDVNGVCIAGAGIQIYDPTTVDVNGNRTPFAGNIIPTGRINAAGAALVKYYPEPNGTVLNGSGAVTANYISSHTSFPQVYYSFVTRVDHSFSDKNKMNATFYKAVLNQSYPNEGFPTAIGPSGFGYTVYRNNMGGSLEDTMVLSPTLVLNARIGGIYHPFGLIYPGSTFNLASLNISSTGLPISSFPGTSMTDNYGGFAAGAGGQNSETTLTTASVLLSKSLQKHSLRIGVEGNLMRYNVTNPQSGFGSFSFNRQFTQQNVNGVGTAHTVGGDANSGDPAAALLLGYPSGGSYGNNIASALEQLYYAAFVQDDWRVGKSLTINVGLRWDNEQPWTDRYNRMVSNFCQTCASPLQSSVPSLSLKGGLQFVTSSNRYPWRQEFDHFQPRVGLEYQINPMTVFRVGTGLIYLDTIEQPSVNGFSASTSYVAGTGVGGTTPQNILSNPFPQGIVAPTGNSLGLGTLLGQSVSFIDPNHVEPYVWQYSTNVETILPGNITMQLGFVGQLARRLEVNKNIDGVPAQYFNQGTAGNTFLTTQVPSPFAGLLPGSSLNSATVSRSALLTPFPEFTGVSENDISDGRTSYSSMQDKLTKRLSHGVTLLASFTWAKIMDKTAYENAGEDPVGKLIRFEDNEPNLLFNMAATYQLPKFASQPRFVREAVGGWSVNGVVRNNNGTLLGTPGGVIVLSHANVGNYSRTAGFNTCYENSSGVLQVTGVQVPANVPACASTSSIPAYEQNPTNALNTAPPYVSGVRGQIHALYDASLFKKFNISESASFEIRGEFFNIFNVVNYPSPSTSIGTSSYGSTSLTQANDPRIGQLTARFNF
jgi:hypothetical protein